MHMYYVIKFLLVREFSVTKNYRSLYYYLVCLTFTVNVHSITR